MRYRRSTKLLLLPIVAIAMTVLAVVARGGGIVVAVFVTFYWIIAAAADFAKQLTIEPDRLEMRGYIGGPIVIHRPETRLCRFVRLRARGRSVEVAFLEIVDTGGRRMQVWRFGWGRRSHELFAGLRDWLASSPADVSPEAERALAALAR